MVRFDLGGRSPSHSPENGSEEEPFSYVEEPLVPPRGPLLDCVGSLPAVQEPADRAPALTSANDQAQLAQAE